MPTYKLAPDYDNTADYVEIDTLLISGKRLTSHVSSLGTYAAAVEIVTLDGLVHDDGFDEFEWTFAGMTPEELASLEDTFLDGLRSNKVTAYTQNRRREWRDVNAVLTTQRKPTLNGQVYGNVVFSFTRGEVIA